MEDSYTVHRRRKAAARRREKTPEPPRREEESGEDDSVARAKMERMVEDTENMAAGVNREVPKPEEGKSSVKKDNGEKVPQNETSTNPEKQENTLQSGTGSSNNNNNEMPVLETRIDPEVKTVQMSVLNTDELVKISPVLDSVVKPRDTDTKSRGASFEGSENAEAVNVLPVDSPKSFGAIDDVPKDHEMQKSRESSDAMVRTTDGGERGSKMATSQNSEPRHKKRTRDHKLLTEKQNYTTDSSDPDENIRQPPIRRKKSPEVPKTRIANLKPHSLPRSILADSDDDRITGSKVKPNQDKRHASKHRYSTGTEDESSPKKGDLKLEKRTRDPSLEVESEGRVQGRETKAKLREKRSVSRHRYPSDTDEDLGIKRSETFPQKSGEKQIIKRSASEMKKQIIPLNNDSLIEDFAKAQEEYLRRERGILAPDSMVDDYSYGTNVAYLRKRKLGVLHPDPQEILKTRENESSKDVQQKKSWFTWLPFFRKKQKIDDLSAPLVTPIVVSPKEKVSFLEFLKALREIISEFKEYVAQNQREVEALKRQRNCCIGELILIIIYCGLGAFVFRFTEGAFEAFYKCGVKRVKRDFLDNLWNYSHNLREEDWKSMARRKLMEFEEQLHNAHEAGVRSYSGQKSWSFLNAIVYCLTVITTIGYGHISPRTLTGRAITIVYALFGIPMFLIILADFGKLFTRGIKFLWAFVRRLYYTGSCRKVRRTGPVQEVMKGVQLVYDFATFRRPSQMNPEEVEEIQRQQTILNLDGNMPLPETPGTPAMSHFAIDDEFNLPISVAITILLGYIFVGAVIYHELEGWDFSESFYFVFISMSTIGFGDFVPQEPLHTMFLIVYLVFGLALTSMCINVVQEMLSDTFKQASQKLSAHIGFEIPAENGGEDPNIENEEVEVADVHVSEKGVDENREEIAPKAKQEDIDL